MSIEELEKNPDAEIVDKLASNMVKQSNDLFMEIEKGNSIGFNKYDVGLAIASLYISVEDLCNELDIELENVVKDKHLIDKVSGLNDNQKRVGIPKLGTYYNIHNLHERVIASEEDFVLGQINLSPNPQKVFIHVNGDNELKYIKQIIAIIYPENNQEPIWIAGDCKLQEKIKGIQFYLGFKYKIELIK